MMPSPSSNTNEETALECGRHLNDLKKPLIRRMNALFMLRKIGGDVAVDEISRCLVDASELLNHELAYCLGQMKNVRALPLLQKIVANTELAVITRHEAAEAVACMGGEESAQLLERFCEDQQVEVAETCQLAVKRIRWNQQQQQQQQKKNNNDDEHNNLLLVNRVFDCVDPTPSGFDDGERSLKELEAILLNADEDLFARYRAMFALRDLQTDEATLVLAKGLKCPSSVLFRHEIGFVLGQLQRDCVVEQLIDTVADLDEHSIVRHECAEALGSIADEKCLACLEKFAGDKSRVVRESCEVALDMYEFERSGQIGYTGNRNN